MCMGAGRPYAIACGIVQCETPFTPYVRSPPNTHQLLMVYEPQSCLMAALHSLCAIFASDKPGNYLHVCAQISICSARAWATP